MIEFEEAGFSYGRTAVLTAVTLTLAPGTFNVLLGPSGSGKTTLLRLAYLDLAPTSGRVRFFGRPIGRNNRNTIAELRRSIGVLLQHARLLEHLPLIDNVALPLRVSGVAPDLRADDLQALLEWVDLAGRADVPPAALSAGERQRAALARAVILSPELILADEPTGDVDWEEALRLLALLVELNRMGKTVVVATHDPNLARALERQVRPQVLRLIRGRVEPAEAFA